MRSLAELLLKRLIRKLHADPESRVSRFMLAKQGPHHPNSDRTRLDRLLTAVSFFLWGLLSYALLHLTLVVSVHAGLDSVYPLVFAGLILLLTLSVAVGFLGGLYELIQMVI